VAGPLALRGVVAAYAYDAQYVAVGIAYFKRAADLAASARSLSAQHRRTAEEVKCAEQHVEVFRRGFVNAYAAFA
jgi:hypothetical protein